MRQIVLDTETTGLSPSDGHRIIEIGCVELDDRRFTGRTFHEYLNPDREIEAEAMEVHGITNEFLLDKPSFSELAHPFLEFVRGAELIIHNAPFDIGFLNHELGLMNANLGEMGDYCSVLDTLVMARKRHPGQRNSLDALCRRYTIDNSKRELHGALLDSEILADLYLIMTGGQISLALHENDTLEADGGKELIRRITEDRPPLKVIPADKGELAAHQDQLEVIQGASSSCIWLASNGSSKLEH